MSTQQIVSGSSSSTIDVTLTVHNSFPQYSMLYQQAISLIGTSQAANAEWQSPVLAAQRTLLLLGLRLRCNGKINIQQSADD